MVMVSGQGQPYKKFMKLLKESIQDFNNIETPIYQRWEKEVNCAQI